MRMLLVGSEGAPGGGCFVLFVPPQPHCCVLCRHFLFVHVRGSWSRDPTGLKGNPGLRPHPPGARQNTAALITFFCEPQQSEKKNIPPRIKIRSRFTEFKVKLPSRFSLVSRQRDGDLCPVLRYPNFEKDLGFCMILVGSLPYKG